MFSPVFKVLICQFLHSEQPAGKFSKQECKLFSKSFLSDTVLGPVITHLKGQ